MKSKLLSIKNEGYVMQLQNFSVNDGEGIRTTIFLCGCPLSCIWCCNPENSCMDSEDHLMTLAEIDQKISRQALFYRKCNGGITFSGGEATLQQGFLRAMTTHFYDKGYHLSLETCGAFAWEEVKDILSRMDLIFYDLKLFDNSLHQLFTGVSNHAILKNLKAVGTLPASLVVRIPLIVGVNAFEENIHATCRFLQEYVPGAKLEFLPYHKLGTDKYKKLGLDIPDLQYEMKKRHWETDPFPLPEGFAFAPQMKTPSPALLDRFARIAASYQIKIVSYR